MRHMVANDSYGVSENQVARRRSAFSRRTGSQDRCEEDVAIVEASGTRRTPCISATRAPHGLNWNRQRNSRGAAPRNRRCAGSGSRADVPSDESSISAGRPSPRSGSSRVAWHGPSFSPEPPCEKSSFQGYAGLLPGPGGIVTGRGRRGSGFPPRAPTAPLRAAVRRCAGRGRARR